jgi:hypothetical protein
MRLVSLVWLLACSIIGGLAILLFAITPFGPDGTIPGPGEGVPGERGPDGAACIEQPDCVDGYLWSVYERTPKIDTGGADFTWKDPEAAEKAGMTLRDYVVGGMDAAFKVTLYRALRALDMAGFKPGIMCGFRDDYRQSIASGRMKAQNDRSFHGGSFRGGYGHGLAADIVSILGSTPADRSHFNDRMWKFIDRHEKELGIGRPYLNHDPPHVAPLDGEEYATHRILPNAQGRSGAKGRSRQPYAAPGQNNTPTKPTVPTLPAKS